MRVLRKTFPLPVEYVVSGHQPAEAGDSVDRTVEYNMYSEFTTPITEVCISSDGALGLANGDGVNFGLWHLWTGDPLRQFRGHTGRVTCICPSVDVSLVVSVAACRRTVR